MNNFENLSLIDSIWLTLTTVTTVGYGDYAPATIYGKFSTIIFIYIGAIAILAQVIALYFELSSERRNNKLKGKWSWIMKDHIVFLNSPKTNGEEYFIKAINQLRSSSLKLAKTTAIIVSNRFHDGLPDTLRRLNVVHVSGDTCDNKTLISASILCANTIVILAPSTNAISSDSLNFDLIHRLREMGVQGRIIVEAVDDHNRSRMLKAGANNIIRPIRSYPELLIRTILAPGSEQIIETMFDSYNEECIRYDVTVKGKWKEIVTHMVSKDLGIPLSYMNSKEEVISNPLPGRTIEAKALFVLARKENLPNTQRVQVILDQINAD